MKSRTLALIAVASAWLGVHNGHAETAGPSAVMCPPCETVWVKAPVGEKARSYTRIGKMVCEDCRSAVEQVFAEGKLEHACGTCGDLKACEAEQANLSAANADQAMTCARCETTWVRKAQQVGKVTIYRTATAMHCAPCDAAARSRLGGGKAADACTACADGLKLCE